MYVMLPNAQHSPAVKQAVAIWGLPDQIVSQGVQGTNNSLSTNAIKQTPSLPLTQVNSSLGG
jgi:hypothetical protein